MWSFGESFLCTFLIWEKKLYPMDTRRIPKFINNLQNIERRNKKKMRIHYVRAYDADELFFPRIWSIFCLYRPYYRQTIQQYTYNYRCESQNF